MGLFDNGYISWLIIPIAMVYGCIYPQNWLIIFFLVKIERFDCGQARSHRFSSVGRCLGWERYRWYQLDNYQFSLAYPTDIQSRPILAYLSIFDFNFDGPIQVAILESSQDQFESSEQIFPYISTYFHIFPHISIYFHIYISTYVHICPHIICPYVPGIVILRSGSVLTRGSLSEFLAMPAVPAVEHPLWWSQQPQHGQLIGPWLSVRRPQWWLTLW